MILEGELDVRLVGVELGNLIWRAWEGEKVLGGDVRRAGPKRDGGDPGEAFVLIWRN